jgi:FkbH-like protein
MLKSLAEIGVLMGVASKNDPAVVEGAFRRHDLIVPRDAIFPMEVHWHAKSASVSRILEAWNVGPESVVFIDDNPAELAEVQAAHPAIECIRFPGSPKEVYSLLTRLRDLFAKPLITAEDRLRVRSLRTSRLVREQSVAGSAAPDAFHQQAESVVTFKSGAPALDARTVELLNKTNQFNLNGIRYTEAELRRLVDADGILIKTNYSDKYGPLGTIAVLLGHSAGRTLSVKGWVMSCRAFSRRIEHACLDHLFRRYDVDAIEFDFAATARNQPLQEFFSALLGEVPESRFALRRDIFYERCAPLFHQIEEEVFG